MAEYFDITCVDDILFYFCQLKCIYLSCFCKHMNFTYGSRGACSSGAEEVSASTTASEW